MTARPRHRPPSGAAGGGDIGTGGRSDVEVDGTTVPVPSPATGTVAVSRPDARTMLAVARRGALSGAERLVIGRLAARLGDYDEVTR